MKEKNAAYWEHWYNKEEGRWEWWYNENGTAYEAIYGKTKTNKTSYSKNEVMEDVKE